MIRDFHETDIDLVFDLIQETIDVSYPAHYPGLAVDFFKDYHCRASIKRRAELGEVIVIENEADIIATGSLVGNEISGVFVLPTRQKLGLRKRVMMELESRALRKDISEITLHISLPARKFYENLQYMISQPQRISVGSGQYLDYWEGTKRIHP